MTTEQLNKKYKPLSPEERIVQLYKDFDKVLLTSSFGTTAGVLLHLIKKINPKQPIHFINTTYHFPETIAYKNVLTKLLGLNVIEVLPEEWKNKFTQTDKTWEKNPDFCCFINKVEPVEEIKKNYEVWISGLMSFQNENRKKLTVFEEKEKMLKFAPIIDFKKEDVENYFTKHNIPHHSLEAKGYDSIGCTHCTQPGKGRSGRWVNFGYKSECGLHI